MRRLWGGKGAQGSVYLRWTGEPASRKRPSPDLGVASEHTRADVPGPRRAQARTCKPGTRDLKEPGAPSGPASRGVTAAL